MTYLDDLASNQKAAERCANVIMLFMLLIVIGLLIFVGVHWKEWDAYLIETTKTNLATWLAIGLCLGSVVLALGFILYVIIIDPLYWHMTNKIRSSMSAGGFWSRFK